MDQVFLPMADVRVMLWKAEKELVASLGLACITLSTVRDTRALLFERSCLETQQGNSLKYRHVILHVPWRSEHSFAIPERGGMQEGSESIWFVN